MPLPLPPQIKAYATIPDSLSHSLTQVAIFPVNVSLKLLMSDCSLYYPLFHCKMRLSFEKNQMVENNNNNKRMQGTDG